MKYLILILFMTVVPCLNGADETVTFTADDWDKPKTITIESDNVDNSIDKQDGPSVTLNDPATDDFHGVATATETVSTDGPFKFYPFVCMALSLLILHRGRMLAGITMLVASVSIIIIDIVMGNMLQSIISDGRIIDYVRLQNTGDLLNQIAIIIIGVSCVLSAFGGDNVEKLSDAKQL